MMRMTLPVLALSLLCGLARLHAQTAERELNIFGYFQASLGHNKVVARPVEANSFNLQQLNLFLQRDLATNWRAFVNVEFVNTYSSFRNWGVLNLEEAWVSYHASRQFKVKLGLQVPTFNNLNEIKNRTPLLPYIIRPLIYEASLNEVIALSEFVPTRAFVQVYGFIPWRNWKLDHAIFVGDSPNINEDPRYGQTGVDTTKSFLVGGRLGFRSNVIKLGVSASFDELDLQKAELPPGVSQDGTNSVSRIRLAGDLSLTLGKFMWESEFVRVSYDDDNPILDLSRNFYYGTAGYQLSERLYAYLGYWITQEKALPVADRDLTVPTVGVAYDFREGVSLKAQYARVRFDATKPEPVKDLADYYYLAVSVVF